MTATIKPVPISFDCDDKSRLEQMRRRVDEALATLSLDQIRLLVEEIEQQLGCEE